MSKRRDSEVEILEEREPVPHSATGLAGSKYDERVREGYVQGSADLRYGEVDGFRYGFESTGARHQRSALGRKVFRSED